MRYIIPAALILSLAGCAGQTPFLFDRNRAPAPAPTAAPAPVTVAPAPVPTADASTPEQLDTTTSAQRQAAIAPETGGAKLGLTIGSLGDPAEPGFWVKTPLVSAVTPGKVEYPKTGRNVQVELRPSGGAPGSGSQVSLAAMRLLDAPLTGLPELVLYRN